MNENEELIETLLGRVVDYGKTNIELIKLKSVDKTSELVSSIVTHTVTLLIFASFWFFLNLGLALWLGELLGNIYYGFFVVTGFYGFVGLVFHFFIHDAFKKMVCNHIIKLLLK
jgi:fatty acid desaturase